MKQDVDGSFEHELMAYRYLIGRGVTVEMHVMMKATSRTPSTLVVRKRDILAGFHTPPVSRAAEDYTYLCLHHPHGASHLHPHDGGRLEVLTPDLGCVVT